MPLLVVLFVVVPLVEIYVIIQVGQAIGPWWTIGLLIVDSILGSMLMRSQGRTAWRRFQVALAGGRGGGGVFRAPRAGARPPAREVLDGALVIFGGALLLTPGFVTDIFGLALLLPPSRAAVRRVLVSRFSHRMTFVAATPAGYPRSHDFEGTARESDPPALP